MSSRNEITYTIARITKPTLLGALYSKIDENSLLIKHLASSSSKESCLKWLAEYLETNPKAQLTILESYEFEAQKQPARNQFGAHAGEAKKSAGFWGRKTQKY